MADNLPGNPGNQVEDANEALESVRNAIVRFHEAGAKSPDAQLAEADALQAAFAYLDEHLRGGGALPDDWTYSSTGMGAHTIQRRW